MEPERANDTYQSFAKGERVTIPPPETIADGLRAPAPGKLTFPVIRRHVEKILLVSEDEIRQAMKYLSANPATVAEPSGAVSVAGFIFHARELFATELNVAVISGGNIEPTMLAELRKQ